MLVPIRLLNSATETFGNSLLDNWFSLSKVI